jgi:hypothetical protein
VARAFASILVYIFQVIAECGASSKHGMPTLGEKFDLPKLNFVFSIGLFCERVRVHGFP